MKPRPAVDRAAILRAAGAAALEVEELLSYTERPAHAPRADFPFRGQTALPDEPFVEAWSSYAKEADAGGVWPTLRRKLIQLRFPIAAGLSATPVYREATRAGVWPEEDQQIGLELDRPEALTLHLQPTAAGCLPVIHTPHRADFNKLVQALARRNEPWRVPVSIGACFINGYTNWDRVSRLLAAGEPDHPKAGYDESNRQERLVRIRTQKALYQDAFVLLSSGPYSAVPADALERGGEEWERLSLIIRREHECAHYVTRRFFGVLSGRVDEELLADVAGLAAALGRYPADWALRFLARPNRPSDPPFGRLENYRTCAPLPRLSDGAFAVLATLLHRAAHQLEDALATSGADLHDPRERTWWLLILSTLTLEELTCPEISAWLRGTRDEERSRE